jgi:hypothetical protein
MHAATVEHLVQKAHLEPDTALAIAAAIDMSLDNAQLVTIPAMDARFAASEAKMDARFTASEAKIDARFTASEAKIDARFAASEAKMETRFAAVDAKMETRFAAVDSRFTASEAKMEAALEKTRAELVRWVFLVMLGNVALSAAAHVLLNAIR